jgi:hypothetical protein
MIYTDNPLNVEIVPTLVPIQVLIQVPVANELLEEVRIEVDGEPVIEPKIESNVVVSKKCEAILDWLYIIILVLLAISIFTGFIIFLVWLNDNNLFGTPPLQ